LVCHLDPPSVQHHLTLRNAIEQSQAPPHHIRHLHLVGFVYFFSNIISWFIFCILPQSQLKMEQKDGEGAAAHEPQCGFPPEVWGHCFSLLEDVRDRVAVAAVPSPLRPVNQ
jgi:hypothetical protein